MGDEYDPEIPQSQTADTARKSHTTITRQQEDKLSKATKSLFPIKMIPKLEWFLSIYLYYMHGLEISVAA